MPDRAQPRTAETALAFVCPGAARRAAFVFVAAASLASSARAQPRPQQTQDATATPSPKEPAPASESPTEPAPTRAPPSPAAAAPPAANLGSPRAFLDYSDGTFFLRSADDTFLLATGGRAHLDTYAFAGPGVSAYRRSNGAALAPNLFFRRFILEGGGLVRARWFFWVGGNFAPTQIDANEAPASTAAVYDGFVGYQAEPHVQVYVGQYNLPVTMENVTSSRWLDFMERALTVRAVAAPYNKDLGVTLWGATREGAAPLEYQVGVYGGDGMNRPNVDSRVDLAGRVVFRPLASAKGAAPRAHVGASGRLGSRDDAFVNYDAPSLSTPGGYTFWSPVATAGDATEVRIIPSGTQAALGAEIYVPFEDFDVRGEAVYVREGRREATTADRHTTLRRGRLEGTSAYLQMSYWPLGAPRVNGHPAGRYFGLRPPKDRGREAPYGLQLLLRGELVRLSYDGNARSPGAPDGPVSARTDDIRVNALQAAATYWATKHVRLTAEYSLYLFPGSPPAAGAAQTNQAAAPGAKNVPANASADHLHELSFRVGLAL